MPSGRPYENTGEILSTYPEINYGTGEQAEKIKRGEYLVKMGDCIACHTVKNGQPFAGGLGFDTPFGLIFSSNITPDKETGIGKWNFKQFKKAVSQGISPGHTYLYPAFPYIYFNKVSDQDLADIKAYLDVVPPVQQKKPKNKMFFPFQWRFLQLGWRILFFEFQKTNQYRYNHHQTAEWNRGAYIVTGLGHCDMCHTPMYYIVDHDIVLGAPIRSKPLIGSYVSGFYAPNITHLFLKDVSLTQFQDIILKYRLVEGGQVQGPMYQVIHDSLQYLSLEDIRAMYTYLFSVKSAAPPKPKINLQDKNAGKKIYDRYCQQCHENGTGPVNGAPERGEKWTWRSWDKMGMDALLWNAMNGVDGMPIKGTCTDCTAAEIESAIRYMGNYEQ